MLIGEAKSAWGSIEETLRTLDVKARLAPEIVIDRFGWKPRTIGVVLVILRLDRPDVSLSGTQPRFLLRSLREIARSEPGCEAQ